jgi:hypothetical protein
MAEWSNAAVLKTVEGHTSGGSNPSFSAKKSPYLRGFFVLVHDQVGTTSLDKINNPFVDFEI